MHSLGTKLLGVFALVIVVGVTVTIVLTRQGTATRFSHFMVGSQMVEPGRLQTLLANYYRQQGSWSDLEASLNELLLSSSSGGMMDGMMGGMMGMFDNRVRVADAQGIVVADSNAPPGPVGALTRAELTLGWPIMLEGRQVGTLLIDGVVMATSEPDGDTLLSGVTRAVTVAALVAATLALILGGILIRQITRPLARLRQASQRIAAGDLAIRVVVNSRDELGQLAETFNRMADALQRQEHLRRQMVADIAHELRTPLAGIQGTVEALQDGIFELSQKNLERVHEQTLLLNRLVDDLRTLSLAEAGELTLNLTTVDVSALARRHVTAFQPQALSGAITLSLEAPPRLPSVAADEQRLGQVLNNLLDNALRHTPPGGTVTVRLAPRPEGSRGGVQIAVIDSGEGISQTDLTHIFERFYRAEHSRNRAIGGSGLGLAIARQLVEANHGHIWAESPPPGAQRGTVFYITLPTGHETDPAPRKGSQP